MNQKPTKLAKRESEPMEAVAPQGEASAAEREAKLENRASNATIRPLLGILVDKNHLRYRKVGRRFVDAPIIESAKAGKSALNTAIATFQ